MTVQEKNDQHYLDIGIAVGKRRFNGYWVFVGFCLGFATALMVFQLGGMLK